MDTSTKPNCYQCQYRRNIPGDARSMCNHPENAAIVGDGYINALIILMTARKQPVALESKLHVTGHPHGIRMGWFNWPVNFDPTWLLTCDGFTEKPT